MLITKTDPVGIDAYIQRAQTVLHTELLKKWGAINYKCYGRAYRNKTDNGYIAEVFDGTNYQEVYWDSSQDAVSFFGISSNITKDTTSRIGVHLVFFVNLSTIKPLITHIADEEVRRDVFTVFGGCSNGLSFQSIDLYLENVLKEYPGSRRDDRLKYVDMHPVHCFRLNYQLSFNPNKI